MYDFGATLILLPCSSFRRDKQYKGEKRLQVGIPLKCSKKDIRIYLNIYIGIFLYRDIQSVYKYTYGCKENKKGQIGMHVSLPFFSLYIDRFDDIGVFPAVFPPSSRRPWVSHGIFTPSSLRPHEVGSLTPSSRRIGSCRRIQ